MQSFWKSPKDREGSSVEEGGGDGSSTGQAASEDSKLDEAAVCGAQQIALAACLCFSFTVAVGIIYYGPTDILRKLLRLVPADPGWDWFVGHGLLTSFSIVLILPIWPPLCMASGLIFGLAWGSLLNFFAILTGAVISLALGRLLFREPIRRFIEDGEYHKMRKIMLVLEDSSTSIQFLVLFRFLWIPMFIRNYGPSTLNVEFWKLVVSCVPHTIWISIIFASLGSTFKDTAQLLRDDKEFSFKSMKWQNLLLFVVSFIISTALAIYAHKKYSEHVASEQQSVPSSQEATQKDTTKTVSPPSSVAH